MTQRCAFPRCETTLETSVHGYGESDRHKCDGKHPEMIGCHRFRPILCEVCEAKAAIGIRVLAAHFSETVFGANVRIVRKIPMCAECTDAFVSTWVTPFESW